MRPSTVSRVLSSLMLAGAALGWLSLAAPVAAGPAPSGAPSIGAPSASGGPSAIGSPGASGGPGASGSAGASPAASPIASATPCVAPALCINPVGSVDDAGYPNIGVTYSIVDPANGRPVAGLTTGSVTPSPAAQITSVTATSSSSANLAAAYVIAIDTSASMNNYQNGSSGPTYFALAKSLANALAKQLGPHDLIKIVTFDQDDTPSHMTAATQTAWLKTGDPAIASSIAGIRIENYGTPLSNWIVAASTIANTPPTGVNRKAMVFITDADASDTDATLTPKSLTQQLGPPTFLVGLHPADKVGAAMSQNLSDVATYTGGSYQTATATTDTTALYKPVLDSTHSTWAIKFHTDLIPDGNSNQEQLTITDSQQRSGTATLTYRSGNLPVVSPLTVEGLAGGDAVTTDRTVTFGVGGTRKWSDARIDLFVDCDPDHCSKPTFTSDNAPLVWKINVATMTREGHKVVVRLTTTDDQQKFYTTSSEIDFTVSGTTWNGAAVVLIGGVAILLIGAFFIAAQRRGGRQTRRAAR